MKICPECAFINDERFPICAYCNQPLADVPVTPSADPNAPEHERHRLAEQRHQRSRGQLQMAAAGYVLAITASAIVPGFIFHPGVLLLYAASSLVVAIAVLRHVAGQFTASFLQAVFTVVLVASFGPMQPMIFFMFALHVILPAVFCHWTELIHGSHH